MPEHHVIFDAIKNFKNGFEIFKGKWHNMYVEY